MKPNLSGNLPSEGPGDTPRNAARGGRTSALRLAAGGGGGPWSNLDRPPLNAGALRRALLGEDGLWTELEVVDETGSTNTDLVERVRRGEAEEGTLLIAERQTAGRGRLDRGWVAPARSGLFFSFVLRPGPEIPVRRLGWLPLLAGVATATALSRAAGVDTALKWPNDLLATVDGEERKIGGILAERIGDLEHGAVVVGIGLNVSLRADELPVPGAGSLLLAGAAGTDRDPLLRAVLRSIDRWYRRWRDAEGDAAACGLQETYAAGCATLGRQVRAELPGGTAEEGEAVAIDGDGQLVLNIGGGVLETVDAGDIVHLRPAG
ncbi:biotin--[acetyl-CoA-carboxylase] ligase [Streptomyces alkaliterrae]|uniref:biotin--[biotin carboxyl-carrier protein] ligase n=1 Tax=Streptomyces alkaliterrae TaxID=2213162 RepID=A0A5P0YYE5_9ACTN|nr:biotin--[acetyl-CoA-carboxylase] ligase [Streptomyces alkaliterrae]MBB1255703.1 biotin--[acetyl-CoA-carboxylase] ligase [Streptomyces alkaliterrae]MBB1258961.1 biotin--[acetyl-CoA-carboxylase] ligase [Streptomyces alkaliterrae]MQS03459.1 biotin--[acetyl-CoA-carboxylase] ligase [Streptomyces alkaliterrae]